MLDASDDRALALCEHCCECIRGVVFASVNGVDAHHDCAVAALRDDVLKATLAPERRRLRRDGGIYHRARWRAVRLRERRQRANAQCSRDGSSDVHSASAAASLGCRNSNTDPVHCGGGIHGLAVPSQTCTLAHAARKAGRILAVPGLWLRARADGCVTLARRLVTAAHLCVTTAGRRAHGWMHWWQPFPETCDRPEPDVSRRLPLQERAVRGRRLLRSAPRGAGLCRVAAARRGVRLATWATVRQRRRQWLWSKLVSSRMYIRLAAGLDACVEHCKSLLLGCGAALIATSVGTLALGAARTAVLAAPAAWLLWRRLPERPTLCGDGVGCDRAPRPALRSKSFKLWARWRRCCSRAQQPLQRCVGALTFGICLTGATAVMPPSLALATSYVATWALARAQELAHGRHCRAATTVAATALTAWLVSGWHALLAAVMLSACPASWLWWPPKGSTTRRICVELVDTKHRLVIYDGGVRHRGPRRASEHLCKRDAAAVRKAPEAEQLDVLERLRANPNAPPLKRGAGWRAPSVSTPAKQPKQQANVSTGTPTRTPRTPGGSRNVELKSFQSVLEFWRVRKRGPIQHSSETRCLDESLALERSMAQKLARYRLRDLSDPKYAATRQALADIQKLEADAREWRLADAPVTATENRMQAEHDAWCRGQRRDPEPRPLLQRKTGRHAYPGLLNLGLTCYLGATIQCLLHCGAARACMLEPPAVARLDGTVGLPDVLHALATACVSGVPVPASANLRADFRARVDLYSPHDLMDTFVEASGFTLGQNYDAVEALEILFRNMAPLRSLFCAPSALTVEDVVCLQPFSDSSDAWGGLGPFIIDDVTKCVDMSNARNRPFIIQRVTFRTYIYIYIYIYMCIARVFLFILTWSIHPPLT